MLKPLRKCKYPGCRVLTPDGYCSEHKPKQVRKASAAWHYLYTDPRYGWETRRAKQLLVEPWCRECTANGRPRVPATDVDHVIPHRGNVELFLYGELQSLCHACHAAKTLAENGYYIGAKK